MLYFNHNLKFLVNKSRLTVATITNDLGIKYETFRRYLSDANPKYDTLIQIANYFEISIDDLLTKDIAKEGYNNKAVVLANNMPTNNQQLDELIAEKVEAILSSRMEAIKKIIEIDNEIKNN